MSSRPRAAWPLVAVFTAGYLAAYLLPTLVGRLSTHLGLSAAQAGLVGSALLLSSAAAGFSAGRPGRGVGPRRPARIGLLLAVLGYGGAALDGLRTAGGHGRDGRRLRLRYGDGGGRGRHRRAARSAPDLDPGAAQRLRARGRPLSDDAAPGRRPRLPFAAIALAALPSGPRPAGSPARRATAPARPPPGRLPHRRSGLVLAGGMLVWSLAQNSLWGVSSRIGLDQAGL